MRTRSQTRRAGQPPALRTNPSGGGSPSSEDTDPLQRNGDVLADHNEFVGGPFASAEGLQVAFGEKRVHCNIRKCHSSNNCKLCLKFIPSMSFVSHSTNRTYQIVLPPSISTVDCNTSNCIYLITCSNCCLQYVGETVQALKARFYLHRSGIRNKDKINMCRRLCEHFQQGKCKGADYTVNIIEVFEGSGRLPNGKVDLNFAANIRRKKETEWMYKLQTAYPYGLNDKTGDDYSYSSDETPVAYKFPSLKRSKPHPLRSRNFPFHQSNSVNSFLALFSNKLRTNIKSCMNFGRSAISSFSKKKLKELASAIIVFLKEQPETFPYTQWYLALQDRIESRFFRNENLSQTKRMHSKVKINIFFENKGIEMINLSKILRNKSVLNNMPSELSVSDIPMITYSLKNPIRSKIFNHKKFAQHLDIEEFLANRNSIPCACENSPFKDPHHNHIITGDLRIVKNNKLRKLICKGPKYREPEPISWDKAKYSIINGLEDTINTLANKLGQPKAAFDNWKHSIITTIEDRIEQLKKKIVPREIKQTLKDAGVITALNDLQNDFVMAPIDKATNNISFICKRFYAKILLKEFGILGTSSKTYEKLSTSLDSVINSTIKDIKSNFSIKTEESMKKLPSAYWLPKMHKSPIGSRFIIASKECTTKKLSKLVTAAFKLVYKSIESYHKKVEFFSGIHSFWVIQNNLPVIKSLDKINKINAAKTVSTFDFSTLYTNIPHDKLIKVLNHIIDFAFKGKQFQNISVNEFVQPRWCKISKGFLFTKESLKKAVQYLIGNSFFTVGDFIFRQKIGIPMGSDPAPFFANLFLHFYEWQWVEKHKKSNFLSTRKLCNTFRFIDDLITINDGGIFEKNIKNIYPSELELKKESHKNTEAHFLDLNILINNSKFDSKLYDKRDDFPFDIVRMPYRTSNIPNKMFYTTASAEILRISKTSSLYESFLETANYLIIRVINQGGNKNKLQDSLKKMIERHYGFFEKFKKTKQEIIQDLLT